MNQLQRIILINSANVSYNEVKLDGNIHFIGTQGTGKSTVLRAILFFYNADSRKLGISSDKEPFLKYYFPMADSYIIYEVRQGDRRFCVWLSQKQGRMCFRFIDGPYEQSLVLENKQVLNESAIIAKASEKGYKVHRPIFNLNDYRDIIYGANKSMRRFSIIQNQSYHNIPRTISNIFLNSSLDGGFIKKTIINSLSDDVFEIDLNKNRTHLESARANYQDVSQYLIHEKKAQNIVAAYDVLLQQEEEQKKIAWRIGAAYNKANQKERVASDQLQDANKELKSQQAKLDKVKLDYANKIRQIQDKLSIVKRDISKTNKLIKEYASKNIEGVLLEYEKESQYVAQRSQIEAQLELLKAGSQEVEAQYQINKQKMEANGRQQVFDIKKAEQEKLECMKEKLHEAQGLFYQEKEKLVEQYDARVKEQAAGRQELTDQLKALDYEMKSLAEKSFFQEELDVLKGESLSLSLQKQDLQNKENETRIALDAATKDGQQQFILLEMQAAQASEKLRTQKEDLHKQMKTLQEDIDALSGSLLEFLEQNKTDWKENVGKVVKKECLLRNDLQPTITSGTDLYGLSLKLDDLTPIQLSKVDLEKDLAEKTKQLERVIKEIRQCNDSAQAEKDKKQKKYNKKISELKSQAKVFSAQKEQSIVAFEKNTLEQKRIKDKSDLEKQTLIHAKNNLKFSLQKQLEELISFVASIEAEMEKTLLNLSKQYDAKQKSGKKVINDLNKETQQQVAKINSHIAEDLLQLLKQRNELLSEKGADINHINRLETETKQLDEKLTFIKDHQTLVIEYKKDREEYIDRLTDFKLERKGLENEIEHKDYLHRKHIEKEENSLKSLNDKVGALVSLLKDIGVQLKKYKDFSAEALFASYRASIEHYDVQDQWNCDELIVKMTNLALEYEKNDKSLTERITEFSGYFSLDNKIGFETRLNTHLQYRAFAQNLKEFVQSQRIIDFKTDVTKKYAMLLENIVAETRELLDNEKAVNKTILRINADFKSSNFVGVVKSIEMRLKDSSNKIIQLLKRILEFESENAMSFGEINLFSQLDSGTNNDEAVKLLESLLVQIGQAKTSKLSLEDAFDLEFRIRENDNDTSWVSRLANVGSNGTDVLVKSMIYINLLHIFKNEGKKEANDTTLHCLIDEVGILHDSNVSGLISFAGERNIRLINGSPNSHNEQDYKHIYMFRKNKVTNKTGITKLISNEI